MVKLLNAIPFFIFISSIGLIEVVLRGIFYLNESYFSFSIINISNVISCEEENKNLIFNPEEILISNNNTYGKATKENEKY